MFLMCGGERELIFDPYVSAMPDSQATESQLRVREALEMIPEKLKKNSDNRSL